MQEHLISHFKIAVNASLMALKPADIMVVKTLKTPPSSVKLAFAGMSAIVGLQPEKQTDPAAKKNVTKDSIELKVDSIN